MNIFRWVLVMLISLLLAGCSLSKEAKPPITEKKLTPVRLTEAVRSVYYAPQYVAFSQGFFQAEHLEVQLQTAWGGDKSLASLFKQETDFILAGPDLVLQARRQHPPLRELPVVFAQLTRRDGSFLIGRQPEPDFTWKNLKGKMVITSRRGSMPEMSLAWLLQQQGIKPYRDVTLVQNIPSEWVEGAFVSGSGHYLQAFEPLASKLENQGQGKVLASLGQAEPELPFAVYLSLPSTLELKKTSTLAFLRALARAQRWVAEHTPTDTAAAIKPFFPEYSQAELEQMLTRYYQAGVWAESPLPAATAFNNLQEMMVSTGQLAAPLPEKELVNPEPARSALSH
ncbi:ABC transporter substrate-binding protein [Carboxydocella sp. ULO1]|uniref:ABC transporter substrate-binding protein n=1 Tax=Carboxydocella sp. ULO1 TaxID=1926599 RepID=UPI0009AE9912|nr:ABC transporter substrate-binding protein [Carboxydocella sp. ULO1]GAW28669.1 hypothetical protein ULO1_12390 [Carboxydocella sp. ULO1]